VLILSVGTTLLNLYKAPGMSQLKGIININAGQSNWRGLQIQQLH